MSGDEIDLGKRNMITGAVVATGGVGAACAALPFVSYWQPSVAAQAAGAPVEVDISDLQPGEQRVVEWRRKPVWIIRRTEEALKSLQGHEANLRDPESLESDQPAYATNETRSLKPEYLVMAGICTHLGCSPTYAPEEELESGWTGGFFCPCHGGKYDLAGRVLEGVPPPKNMMVPPHYYLSDTVLLIGEDEGVA
ncbi:MAG: ubiquinol-cytochrome c reductase iron-sulfur subunit [Immundisolibacteraceae bacterium]|nr:ubiquinol-cytochrome c reductase iron-sulfur subunit [Immundisolibacteraceae bacterium]